MAKLRVALDLYYSAKELKAAGLKQQHPDWSTERINEIYIIFEI